MHGIYIYLRVSVVLLIGLDKRHSLYRVVYWNTTEALRIFVSVGILGVIYFLVVLLLAWIKGIVYIEYALEYH